MGVDEWVAVKVSVCTSIIYYTEGFSREADVHEDSYLPFLFQADDEPGSAGHQGRRQFGKNGKEVEAKVSFLIEMCVLMQTFILARG